MYKSNLCIFHYIIPHFSIRTKSKTISLNSTSYLTRYNKAVMSWKPTVMRPRGRPRRRWIYMIEEDIKRIGMNDW
jgi:hypothetical protein